MKSLFTGIDSSSHTAVSYAQVINSFMSLFYLFISFFVIANFFLSRSLGTFHGFRFRFRDSVSGFRIPCFSAAVFKREFLCLERFHGRFLHFDIGVKERSQNVRLKLIFCHVLS